MGSQTFGRSITGAKARFQDGHRLDPETGMVHAKPLQDVSFMGSPAEINRLAKF
ncbi:MAG: hypothetical protein QHH07_10275 [Sedimentisphaerales bacterium]|nr:hypothetical protein [Sedimentisphaerales bacterium]